MKQAPSLPAIVYCAWCAILAFMIVERRYTAFLLPYFGYLLFAAAVVMLAFLMASLTEKRTCAHGHADRGTAAWLRAGWLLLPIVYVSVGQQQILGSYAASARMVPGTNIAGLFPAGWFEAFEFPEHGRVGIDDLWQFTDDCLGQRVTVEGMVRHDPDLPEGHAMVFRFVMWCCAADSMPVWVVVPIDSNLPLESDAWVRVTGVFSMRELDGGETPYIDAERMEAIEQPRDAYLY